MLTQVGSAMAAAASLAWLPVAAVAAATPSPSVTVTCTNPDRVTGQCDVIASGTTTTRKVIAKRATKQVECTTAQGAATPCFDPQFGYYDNATGCYYKVLQPPPPFSDSLWGGHTNGNLYTFTCPGVAGTGGGITWLRAAPGGAGVDPRAVAQQALKSMQLHAISIGITPQPGPQSVGLVGMPTYLWVAQPSPQSYGPVTRAATAGGVTVTATAKVSGVTWAMGDGHSVTCAGPGTPYQDAFGAKPSPTCGYTYTKQGDPFVVTATSHWVVDWAGGGQAGTIPMDLTATTQIRVGEVQVLVQ